MATTRVDPGDVAEIAEFDTLTDGELQPFIEDAETIIDNRLKGHTTDANLSLIEKWLAAHLASMVEQRVNRETVGPITKEYEGGEFGQGLKSTRYGQQAIALDPTGRLEAVSRNIVTVNPTSSNTDGYEDYYLVSE